MNTHLDTPRSLAELPAWARYQIEEQQREIERLKRELQVYQDFDHVPKKIASHSQKATWRAALDAMEQGHPDENGMVEIFTAELASKTDQSKQAVLDHLQRAREVGFLRKETEKVRDASGQVTGQRVFIGPTLFTHRVKDLRVGQSLERHHGGVPTECTHCHSKRLRRRVIIECLECHTILSDTGDGSGGQSNPESQIDISALTPPPEPDIIENFLAGTNNREVNFTLSPPPYIPESQIDFSVNAGKTDSPPLHIEDGKLWLYSETEEGRREAS